MSAVTVNLKQFYQRRGMWLMYAFWALIGYFLIHSAIAFSRTDKTLDSAYVYLWQLVLCLFSGGFVGSMLGEGLTRPLVYMTPGYQVVLRKILLCSGLFICSLWCVVLVFLPKTLRIEPGINFIGLWGLNLLGFVLGVAFQFAGGWKLHLFWIMGPLVIWQGPGVIASLRILGDQYPWAALGVAIILGIMGWRYLGKEGWVRNFQDEKWLPFFGLIPRSRRKYAETPKPGPVFTGIDGFFLKRIQSCHPDGTMKYIWGQLYILYGGGMSLMEMVFIQLILVLIMATVLGYIGSHDSAPFIAFVVSIPTITLSLPLFSSLLITAGRNIRFAITFFTVVYWTVCASSFVIVVAASSMIFDQILPDFAWKKFELTYHVISIKFTWMPLAFIPVIATLRITWGWKPVYFILYIVSHVPLLFFMVAITPLFLFLSLTAWGYLYILILWIMFISVCWLAAMRAPLIPKRTGR